MEEYFTFFNMKVPLPLPMDFYIFVSQYNKYYCILKMSQK